MLFWKNNCQIVFLWLFQSTLNNWFFFLWNWKPDFSSFSSNSNIHFPIFFLLKNKHLHWKVPRNFFHLQDKKPFFNITKIEREKLYLLFLHWLSSTSKRSKLRRWTDRIFMAVCFVIAFHFHFSRSIALSTWKEREVSLMNLSNFLTNTRITEMLRTISYKHYLLGIIF